MEFVESILNIFGYGILIPEQICKSANEMNVVDVYSIFVAENDGLRWLYLMVMCQGTSCLAKLIKRSDGIGYWQQYIYS